MADEWRPEPLPGERTARYIRNAFVGGLEGESPNPSPVIATYSEQQAQMNGQDATEASPPILFAYDYMIVP